MRRVSLLASIFEFIGVIPFVIFALVWGVVSRNISNDYTALYFTLGIIVCFQISAFAFLAWAVLHSLGRIHQAITKLGGLPKKTASASKEEPPAAYRSDALG